MFNGGKVCWQYRGGLNKEARFGSNNLYIHGTKLHTVTEFEGYLITYEHFSVREEKG